MVRRSHGLLVLLVVLSMPVGASGASGVAGIAGAEGTAEAAGTAHVDALPEDATGLVVATGVVDYAIVKDGVPPTCAGEGPFAATFDPVTGRFNIVGSAIGCVPVFSLITGCETAGDGTVVCDKVVGEDTIHITLAPDGMLDYVWDGPGFHETIGGIMHRAP